MGLLDGKVALVTGAGRGIGRAHALELAAQGARVVVNDLGGSVHGDGNGRIADVVVELIRARGGQAVADYGNVAVEADVEAMVDRGVGEWGRFDILVNNAGIVRDKTIWNMSTADFDAVMNVHMRGTWLACRAAARHWRKVQQQEGRVYGRIVNTISGAGLSGNFGQSNYAPAKAAIMSLTLTLSLELASMGVTANAIGPGAVTRLSANDKLPPPREADEYAPDEWDPFGPQVSSPMVAWLASEEASYVSGQCFKAFGDKITLMEGWTEGKAIKTNKKLWAADKLGRLVGVGIFGTRAAGLQMGQ